MTTSDAQECVTKVCTKCGEEKPLIDFPKKSGKCVICERERNRLRAEEKRRANGIPVAERLTQEQRREKKRIWAQEHKEQRKKYYEDNKVRILQQQSSYMSGRKQIKADYDKKRLESNRDLINQKKRQYYQQNKEYCLKKSGEYQRKNRPRCNAMSAAYYRRISADICDNYIVKLINRHRLVRVDVDSKTIQLKRFKLQFYRLLNQQKQILKELSNAK